MAADKNKRPNSLRLKIPSIPSIGAELIQDGQSVFSPMTELAINFEQSCKSYSSTPRRRLSLSEVQNSPTPLKPNGKTVSVESGICVDFMNDMVDSPTIDAIRDRSRKSSTSEFSLRRQATFRRYNSLQSTSSFTEPLAFRLSDGENSPMKSNTLCNDDTEFLMEMSSVGLPDELKLASPQDSSLSNRSLSAPPVLEPVEKYFEDLDGNSNSPSESDGFDFIEEDQNSNDISVPTGMSNLLDGEILNKGSGKKQIRKKSNDERENVFPLADKENIIPENEPLHDQVLGTVFKRPSQLIRKTQKRSVSFSVKRTDSQRDFSPVSSKKSRVRSQSLYNTDEQFKIPALLPHNPSPLRLGRSMSADSPAGKTKNDLSKILGLDDGNLIGDRSKECCLPLIERGQHQDLKAISPETLSKVLNGDYEDIVDTAIIVDCRYPYEFKGGHIKDAINVYTKEDIIEEFLKKPKCSPNKRMIIIFHCEFSSKRGPGLCRFLRNKDRDIHRNCYPKLYYPELYLLEGGYKAFFNDCKEYCEPQEYLKMLDEDYSQDLKHFVKRSKSWSGETNRMRTGLRY